MLYALLYRVDRAAKKTTIVIPDAESLTVEAGSFTEACVKARREAAKFFNRAKSRGDKLNPRTSVEEVEKLSGYKGWSVASIEIDARPDIAPADDLSRPRPQWVASGGRG